ncbi:MAG: hypothetical protein K2X97_20915 [Mycobacteriaceae bacterium]|nr:hypothetical protein [Mycobacteriaceae bacterium]
MATKKKTKLKDLPHVQCLNCNGTGTAPLNTRFATTLAALVGTMSAHDLATRLGIKYTNTCNRLVWLESQGLVVRQGQGHRYDKCLWTRTGVQVGRPIPAEA